MSAELGQAVNEVVAAHRSAVRPSHLARHWLLSVLDQQVLERLRHVMQTVAFQPGDVIADLTSACNAFYIVVIGSVEVTFSTSTDESECSEPTSVELVAGDTFGEDHLVFAASDAPAVEKARAKKQSILLKLRMLDLMEAISQVDPSQITAVKAKLSEMMARKQAFFQPKELTRRTWFLHHSPKLASAMISQQRLKIEVLSVGELVVSYFDHKRCQGVYWVLSGAIDLSLDFDGDAQTVDDVAFKALGPRECFGESALLSDADTPQRCEIVLSAEAVQPTVVVHLSKVGPRLLSSDGFCRQGVCAFGVGIRCPSVCRMRSIKCSEALIMKSGRMHGRALIASFRRAAPNFRASMFSSTHSA